MIAWLRELRARTLGWLLRRQHEHDLQSEMAPHLEMGVEDYLRRGMSPQDAQRGLPHVDSLLADVRYALRGLRRNPAFTTIAVMTLAIGIGVNAAVFTIAKGALFAGFPLVERNDRVLYLSNSRGCCLSYPDFLDWRAQAKSFEGMAAVVGVSGILSDESGSPESYDGTQVTADTFRVIGQTPLLGRDFEPADERAGARPVAILSYAFWQRRFAGNPAALGRIIRMNGVKTTIVGVMRPGFSFPQKQDLWVPIPQTPERLERREDRSLWFAFGRMADGVTTQSARAEMELIGRRLGGTYARTNRGRNLLPQVQTFSEFFILENEKTIYASMWGAVGFVLLIACANLANLTLARTMERSREIAVRLALGAGRWRIVRQLLIESVLLSSAGSALGWWIAAWVVHAYELADRGPGRSPWRILDYAMDYRVLGYLAVVSIATASLFGLAPISWLSKLNLNAMIKDGGRNLGSRTGRLSGGLVIAEMALAVMLLAGAGVMIRSFLNIYTTDLGVKTHNVLALTVTLPPADYPSPQARIAFFDRAQDRFAAIPGVESVTVARSLPAGGTAKFPVEFEGVGDHDQPTVSSLVIGPGYFQTMSAGLRAGREFDHDTPSGVPVAIVNERLAETYWPSENPLGKHLRLMNGKVPGPWLTVVGLAPNIVQDGATRQASKPLLYLPFRQRPGGGMEIIARTRVQPGALAGAFRTEMQRLDARVPVFGPVTLDERLRVHYWSRGLYGALFLSFAAIALLIAAVGLFAVIARAVSRRTQEIGIRMAVGATSADIRGLVLRQGMLPTAIGLVIGLTGSLALNRILQSMLVQVSPADPLALFGASVTLILAAMLGCFIPARRAMRLDPLLALRHD